MPVPVTPMVTAHFGLLLGDFFLLVQLFDGLDLFLEFHPPVLEPDLDLPLCQAQLVGHFYSPPSGEVMVGVKLFLQLQGLVSCVSLSAPSTEATGTSEKMCSPCRKKAMQFILKII